jgi:hypothetical protein
MSWISDGRGGEELVRKKSMRRPSAKFYPGVGEDCILPVAANAGASKLTAPGASRNEHRRLGPLIVKSNPQRACRPGARGVTNLNWFDAAFRIDRIGCP